MAIMAATASTFLNYSPYLDMASSKLGGTSIGTVYVHGMIRIKYPTKLYATKVGFMDQSMLSHKVTSILLKPRMMLDREKKGPNLVPDLGLGRRVQDDLVYRQKYSIRSYEVGPHGTASIETLMHILQETTANDMKTLGLMCEGFRTAEMSEKNLVWVMVKMQMVVDRYPTWGDIVQVDIWKVAHGKNGTCCNMTVCDPKTSEILVRASSFWVMMNTKTRKLSKFPIGVRTKLEQYYMDSQPIVENDTRAWWKGEENIEEHICKGLKPRWSELDTIQHLNNVKYIGLILESTPQKVLEKYEINSMTLEYYRECTKDSVLQSLTSILANNNGEIGNCDIVDCQHLLQFEIGGNIMKGRTRWRLRRQMSQDSGASDSTE